MSQMNIVHDANFFDEKMAAESGGIRRDETGRDAASEEVPPGLSGTIFFVPSCSGLLQDVSIAHDFLPARKALESFS